MAVNRTAARNGKAVARNGQAAERITWRPPTDVAKRVRAAAKRNRVSVNTYMTAAAMFAVDRGLQFFHDAPTGTDG